MYGFNPFMFPFPYMPRDLDVPPTLYSILNSIANYGQIDKTKIKNLASSTRSTVFDFDYPLSSHIEKSDFEIKILNHFIRRRIGFETFTAFQIGLCDKLNEIMPKYNKLFDSMNGWNLFSDGQITEKTGEIIDNKNTSSTGTNEMSSENHVEGENTIKNKHSDLPQSELQDIDDSSYVNIYENNNNVSDTTSSSSSEGSSTDKTIFDSTNNYTETIKQSQTDLASLYIDFQNNVESIYTLIYKDLNTLFYGLL